jgi:hypothetical protein
MTLILRGKKYFLDYRTRYIFDTPGKSSDGIRASKSIVSGQAVRFPSRMALELSSVSLTITTPCGCTRPVSYLTPADRLAGRHLEIFLERDRKLELARQNRKTKRQSLTKYHCFE